MTSSLDDTQHNSIECALECRFVKCRIFYWYAEGHYAEGRYAEGRNDESHGACLRIPLLGAVKRSAIAAYSSPSS